MSSRASAVGQCGHVAYVQQIVDCSIDHEPGQAGLGLLYFKGQSVQRDYAEAYFWLSLVAGNYSEAASVDVMESKLRSEVVSDRDYAARQLSKEKLGRVHTTAMLR